MATKFHVTLRHYVYPDALGNPRHEYLVDTIKGPSPVIALSDGTLVRTNMHITEPQSMMLGTVAELTTLLPK